MLKNIKCDYIEVRIDKASYSWNKQRYYGIYEQITKTFKDMGEFNSWLKEEYKNCKTVKMYRDVNDKPQQSGIIKSFRNEYAKCLEEHWIEVFGVNKVNLFK